MTGRLRHLLLALVLAATFGQARALTLDIGDLVAEGPVTLSRAFSAGKSFMDVFNFTLPGTGVVSFDWTSSGVAGLKLTAPEGITVTSASGMLLSDPLPGGPYTASLAGAASAGGTYQITLSTVSAVPVPEPGAWMVLLAGAALLGVIVRKRTR